jgi:hypothetical protein
MYKCKNPFCGREFKKSEGRNSKYCTAACRDKLAEWRKRRGSPLVEPLLAWDIDVLRTKHLELLEEVENARSTA